MPFTVAALALGVGAAATRTRLIATAGRAQGIGAGRLGTAVGAVALTTVATATNEYRCAAAGTEVATSRRFHRRKMADGCSTGSGNGRNAFHATSPAWGTGRGIGENLVIWAGVACFLRLARFLARFPRARFASVSMPPRATSLSLPDGGIAPPGWFPILVSDFYLFFRTALFSCLDMQIKRGNHITH